MGSADTGDQVATADASSALSDELITYFNLGRLVTGETRHRFAGLMASFLNAATVVGAEEPQSLGIQF